DCASACLYLMDVYEQPEHINIGVGIDIAVSELAEIVRKVVGYDGEIVYDKSKPDGTPRKLVDVSKIFALGWQPRISLEEGIRSTYERYVQKTFAFVPDAQKHL